MSGGEEHSMPPVEGDRDRWGRGRTRDCRTGAGVTHPPSGMNRGHPGLPTLAPWAMPGRTRARPPTRSRRDGLRRPRAPDTIAGRYVPQRMLGRGGAKEVWLAHDLTLDRPVALARALRGAAATSRARAGPARGAADGAARRPPADRHRLRRGRGGRAAAIVARFMAGGSLAERAARGARAPAARLGGTARRRRARRRARARPRQRRRAPRRQAGQRLARRPTAARRWATSASPWADAAESRPARSEPRTTVAPEQARGRSRPAGATCTRSARRSTSCSAAGRRSRGPTAGADRPASRRGSAAGVASRPGHRRPELDRLLLRLLAKRPRTARRRPKCATRSPGLRGAGGWGRPAARAARRPRARARAGADALREARAGGLRVVGLSGEPGMGKTRLASEIEAEAARRRRARRLGPRDRGGGRVRALGRGPARPVPHAANRAPPARSRTCGG